MAGPLSLCCEKRIFWEEDLDFALLFNGRALF